MHDIKYHVNSGRNVNKAGKFMIPTSAVFLDFCATRLGQQLALTVLTQ